MNTTKSTAVCSPTTATSKKSSPTKSSNGFSLVKEKVKPSVVVTDKVVKASPLATTTISKSAYVTSLKTCFTTPHRLQNIPNHKDIALVHESRIFKGLLAAAAAKKEVPKRDPILQNNQEASPSPRHLVKRNPIVDQVTPCSTEFISRSKNVGEFNHVYNPQSQEAKVTGVKTYVTMPSESMDENQRRLRKSHRNKSSNGTRNPITEGDSQNLNFKRLRGAGEQFDHQQKLNDRKYLLPAERGASPKGRVFRDMTVSVVGFDLALQECATERVNTEPNRPLSAMRPMSAMEEKMRGSIKGVLEYADAPKYRDDGVSSKCTTVKFNDLAGGVDNERIFARKSTLV